MPELPEVEIIRRGLEKYIVGSRIEGVEIRSPKQFSGDPKCVIGVKILGARRLGKGLVIDLSNGFSIAIHVKMTGQLIFYMGPGESLSAPVSADKSASQAGSALSLRPRPTSSIASLSAGARREPLTPATHFYRNDKHTHVIFTLKPKSSKDSNSYLYYNDIRKFGWVRVVETDKVMELVFFKNLGPEPLRDLNLAHFRNILASSKAPIKSALMDQKKIAGLGNIYANEALFLARIDPRRSALSLHKTDAKRLLGAIEEVLKRGIEAGGSSMTNYVNALGEKGKYQEQFLVYGREGEKCHECRGFIKRAKLGGRGTFYCPKCQK